MWVTKLLTEKSVRVRRYAMTGDGCVEQYAYSQ